MNVESRWTPTISLVIPIILGVSTLLMGCTDQSDSDKGVELEPGFLIQVNRTKGLAPMDVTFSLVNVTGKVRSFRWDFGDDSANTYSDPASPVVHEYSVSGRYDARVELEFAENEYITKSVILHVSYWESVSSSLSVSEEEEYDVPVKDMATDVTLELSYFGGQNLGDHYQNQLDMLLYYPNGTLFDSTLEQDPSGSTRVKALSIPYQYMAASEFDVWKLTINAKSGINVDYVYLCQVSF
jgi:hypothetical protein